jgi:hypothetical protein
MKRQRLPALRPCDFIEVDARSIFVPPVIGLRLGKVAPPTV